MPSDTTLADPIADLDLASLIGSRICHDLISPIGAIGNGVELLSMSGSVGPELSLVSESVDSANARIRFFRIAFGLADARQSIGRSEILSILTDLYRGSRLSVQWVPADDCPRNEVKLAFLAILCIESALPFGGQIQVTRTDRAWRVQGSSDKLKPAPGGWEMLQGQATGDITASNAHFALLADGAKRQDRRLVPDSSESQISIAF